MAAQTERKVHAVEPVPATPAPALPERPAPRPRVSLATWAALLALAAAAPYLNTLGAAFTFDDHGLVLENPMATPGMSPFAWFLRESTSGSLYRPLTMLTYAVDQMVSPAAWSFHLGNLLLHVFATVVAFDLARVLVRSTPVAVATALLFAVHPVHTEAVASVAGRAELLAGLFVMLALSAMVRAERNPSWRAVSLIAFALGAFSKESALTMVPLAALVLVWTGPVRAGRLIRGLLPYAVVGLGCLALRRAVVGSFGLLDPPPFIDNPLAHVGIGSRIATAVVVLFEYLSVLAVPIRLSADESFNQVPVVVSATDLRLFAAVGVFVIVGGALLGARRRVPVLGFGLLFFLGAMTVTANVLFPIGTIKAERLLYLPSFGACLAGGWLLRRWTGRRWSQRMAIAGLGLTLLGARTWIRNADWHDDFALFTRTAETSPASARAQANAAALYGQAGRLDLAEEHFRAAHAIAPQFAPAAMGLAQVADARGQRDDALRWYEEAVSLDPRLVRARERANALRQQGRAPLSGSLSETAPSAPRRP